jgi:hypothetical protein
MNYGLDYPFKDFSNQFNKIGSDLGEWNKNRKIENALANFKGDYEAAASELMRLGLVDEASRLYTAAAIGNYRSGMLGVAETKAKGQSIDDRIFDAYLGGNNTQPMQLGPDEADAAEAAEAAGTTPPPTPGHPVFNDPNAPSVVQDKLGSTRFKKAQEAEGKGAGDRASFRTGLAEAAPQVNELVNGLITQIRDADEGTFANALGPLQGVAPPEDWRGTITSGVPQTLGAISNYLEKGSEEGFTTGEGADWRFKEPGELGGGFTDTLRTQVLSTQASLIGVMQRLLRIPGIGAQSDYELKQIIAQAGELSKARTKADFKDRLGTVLTNLKSIGIPLNLPSLDQVTGPSNNKTADRYANPEEGPVQGSMASPDVDGKPTMRQPPTPPARALNALKAYRANPQARAAFDEIYGPGAAEFYLQKSR